MTKPLNVVPHQTDIETDVKNTTDIASALQDALSDTYHLMFKSQAYHWNVEGPLFFPIHKLTEEHYEDLFGAIDELAERLRALGQLAPINLTKMIKESCLTEPEKSPTAGEMVSQLADDHILVSTRMHTLAKIAGDNNDIVTEDMAVGRSRFHEQAAWMLRATASQ
ncbi:DNA starvation/stationary phase protection protein [Amylibacter ulvae]|uniref:DNA starvation/stationary phase protection protein n=1 Tax=Paramylibacter ulvae TaxID=1651968 RepID=A0ABQ3CZW5_9RHOB|nr:DNA starvation/stationary phase protection protein [Amylibacter ulvae]GHA44098.1 DNA starvation/stationary phase protection protein [Amylibacter ulvae]